MFQWYSRLLKAGGSQNVLLQLNNELACRGIACKFRSNCYRIQKSEISSRGLSVKRILVATSFVLPAMISGQSLVPDAAMAQGARTNWSGPTVGVVGGGVSGTSTQTDPGIAGPTGSTGSTGLTGNIGDGRYHMGGGLVGVGAGFNWQSANWVFGVAGDFSGGNVSGSSNTCGPTTVTPHPCGTSLDSLGTLRGLVGYAMGPTGNWLPYVTGGLAFGDVHAWDALTPAAGTVTRTGWTVGAGVATMVVPNWVVKFEYLHFDLGSANIFNIVPGVPETVTAKGDLFRLGVAYQFGQQVLATPRQEPTIFRK
jgi:outer membrane immunogenic protein